MSLTAKDITCIYGAGTPMERKALDCVTVSLAAGEHVSVVGHTGSGKSTLAYHMNMLMFASSGTLSVDGREASAGMKDLRSLRRKVGLVFQYPEQQFFSETVIDEIEFAPRAWGASESEIKDAVDGAVEAVGLRRELLTADPFALSGGEQRRVAIASILSATPNYLILDEPTAGLDQRGIRDLSSLIGRLRAKGIGILHITHDLESALFMSDRVVVLEAGRAIFTGSAEETAAFISERPVRGMLLPPVVDLCIGLREKGIDVPRVARPERIISAIKEYKRTRGLKS